VSKKKSKTKIIFDDLHQVEARNISPYLIDMENVIVSARSKPLAPVGAMKFGNMPYDGGRLIFSTDEKVALVEAQPMASTLLRRLLGAEELISGKERWCLWIDDTQLAQADAIPEVRQRIEDVKTSRLASSDIAGRQLAQRPHQFRERHLANHHAIVVPAVSSEERQVLPCALVNSGSIITNRCFQILDGDIVDFAFIVSRMHYVWADTVGGKLESRFNYSSTLVFNTFPVPPITEQHKAELTTCAEAILLAREAHFPATIADLYDPEAMPDDLRRAHEANDETLERIYIGRRFKNDTERLEKLFEMYTKMTASTPKTAKGKRAA
jgi:hypothetical protein